MKPNRPLLTTLLCLALSLSPLAGTRAARAADADLTSPAEGVSAPPVKISPDLLPTHAAAESLRSAASPVAESVRAIVQTEGESAAALEQFLSACGGRVLRRYEGIGAAAVELPAVAVAGLAELPWVRYVSKDRATRMLGHVSLTTGADAVRAQSNSGGSYTLDGAGVAIAVIDSGVSP